MLQNESVDEDLEHFEDIVEDTDTERHMPSKGEENNVEHDQSRDKANPESDSSEDEDDSSASSSEEDVSDDAEELHIEDDSKEFQKSQPPFDRNGNQLQISSTGSSLPGGYNPRHREPSYWYVCFFRSVVL